MEVIQTQTEPALKALILLPLEDGDSKDVQNLGIEVHVYMVPSPESVVNTMYYISLLF
jgi:hypothetical protein